MIKINHYNNKCNYIRILFNFLFLVVKKNFFSIYFARFSQSLYRRVYQREKEDGQGLLEKILLAVVVVVLKRAMTMAMLLRKYSSRVHKQTDKTRGGMSVCKRRNVR